MRDFSIERFFFLMTRRLVKTVCITNSFVATFPVIAMSTLVAMTGCARLVDGFRFPNQAIWIDAAVLCHLAGFIKITAKMRALKLLPALLCFVGFDVVDVANGPGESELLRCKTLFDQHISKTGFLGDVGAQVVVELTLSFHHSMGATGACFLDIGSRETLDPFVHQNLDIAILVARVAEILEAASVILITALFGALFIRGFRLIRSVCGDAKWSC